MLDRQGLANLPDPMVQTTSALKQLGCVTAPIFLLHPNIDRLKDHVPVAQVYAGGEACDITGQHRETEVQFVCSEEGKEGIKSIREHATCRYTLVFATSRLCKHPGFQIPKQPVQTIVCSLPGGSQQAESTVPAQPLEGAQEAEGAQ